MPFSLRAMPLHPMRSRLQAQVLACFLMLLCLVAGIAPARAAESLYQVEVIVFQYGTPAQAVTPATSAQVAGLDLSAAVNPAVEGSGMELLPDKELQLTGVEQRLKRAGDIPLVHIGWRQKRTATRDCASASNWRSVSTSCVSITASPFA